MQRSRHDIWVGLFVLLGAAAIVFMALKAANLLTLNFDSTYAITCLLYTSPSPRDLSTSRMPSSA